MGKLLRRSSRLDRSLRSNGMSEILSKFSLLLALSPRLTIRYYSSSKAASTVWATFTAYLTVRLRQNRRPTDWLSESLVRSFVACSLVLSICLSVCLYVCLSDVFGFSLYSGASSEMHDDSTHNLNVDARDPWAAIVLAPERSAWDEGQRCLKVSQRILQSSPKA